MKLSLAWLKELVDLSGVTAEQAADALTFHTAEVEGVEALGAGLDAVKTARVLTAARHPQADRLSVCTVDAGDGLVHRVRELGGSERLQDDRGVGCAVNGPQSADGLDVAGVGDHRRHRSQLVELGCHGLQASDREEGKGFAANALEIRGPVANMEPTAHAGELCAPRRY